MTPELLHGVFLQFGVNMTMQDGSVMPDGDPEEPGRLFDREFMVGFGPRYEGRIVGGSKGRLGIVLQALIQIH